MKRKILVVDDNELMRDLFKEWLESLDYEVKTARNGQEGIMLLKKFNDFDLIITDLRMPKVNGIEVIRFIKQWDPIIKTILITGEDMRLVESVAKAAGADKIVPKNSDFSLKYVFEAVKELLAQ